MFAHSVRDSAAELAALSCLLVVGLSGCSSNGDAVTTSDGGQTGQTNRSSQSIGAATSSVGIRDNLAQLAADTAALREASQTLIDKETVSEQTRNIAQEAQPIFAEQEAQLVRALGVDVDPSEINLDAATLDRLNTQEGPHADMAYLTLMEGSLDKLLDRWEELQASGGKDFTDFANSSHNQLTELQAKLHKRMQY